MRFLLVSNRVYTHVKEIFRRRFAQNDSRFEHRFGERREDFSTSFASLTPLEMTGHGRLHSVQDDEEVDIPLKVAEE